MLTKLFLMPLFLHVLLIFWVGARTLSSRVRSIRNGSAKISEVASDSGAWPRKTRVLGNNFNNQFETPMLWYAAAGLIVALQLVDLFMVGLSWFYLMTRFAHSLVQTGNNDVPSRMRIFLLGFFTLLTLWMWFGFKFFLTR